MQLQSEDLDTDAMMPRETAQKSNASTRTLFLLIDENPPKASALTHSTNAGSFELLSEQALSSRNDTSPLQENQVSKHPSFNLGQLFLLSASKRCLFRMA